MKKIYEWLLSRSTERWFFLVLGLVIAAFCALVPKIEWAVVPTFCVGFLIEFIRLWRTNEFRWKNFVCMLIGGVIVWIFQLIG